MPAETDINHVISELYDAAISQGNWPDVADRLRLAFSANSGLLQVIDIEAQVAQPLGAYGYDERALADYQAYFWRHDLWLNAGTAELPAARAAMLSRHVPPGEFERSEIWNDHLKFNNRQFFCVGAWVPLDKKNIGVVGIHRIRSVGDFDTDDELKLQLFLPHFRRALLIARSLDRAKLTQHVALEALDALAVGLILVDGVCRVVHANRRAEMILGTENGLFRKSRGVLSAKAPGETQTLRLLVAEASSPFVAGGSRAGGVMSVSRAWPASPLAVLVAPLSPTHVPRLPAQPMALVLISDPSDRPAPPEEFLRTLFGLTPAEARLAVAMGEGATVSQLAETFEITANTVRSHVKHIFEKMGINRQAELVRILARLPLPPRSSDD